MQTFPTHAVAGALVAQTALTFHLIPEPNIHNTHWYLPLVWWGVVWFVGIAGALTPDLVMAPMFFYDRFVRKTQPMTKQGPIMMAFKEMSHSLFVWGALWILAWNLIPVVITLYPFADMDILLACRNLALVFVAAGILGGVLPDIPSHSEERFRSTDCTFLYPFGFIFQWCFGFNAIRWPNDKHEYRKKHGDLSLKPWEWQLNVAMFIAIYILLLISVVRGIFVD